MATYLSRDSNVRLEVVVVSSLSVVVENKRWVLPFKLKNELVRVGRLITMLGTLLHDLIFVRVETRSKRKKPVVNLLIL